MDSVRLGARETVHCYMASNGATFVYHSREENGLDEGWLHTSWVRFGTLETKFYDQVKVICDPAIDEGGLAGTVAVYSCDDEENETLIGTLNPNIGQEGTFKIMARDGITDLGLRFVLKPDEDDDTRGPIVAAWSLRAWPAVKTRGEQVVPLAVLRPGAGFAGCERGLHGYARARWEALTEQLTDGRRSW